MKIPYKIQSFQKIKGVPRYIILHDTTCKFEDMPEFLSDTNKFQVNHLKDDNFILYGEYDINFHYIVTKVDDEYQTILGRPISVQCKYNDIHPQYEKSIHIGMMGNMNTIRPTGRYYQQLAYRIISPMIHMFKISLSNIITHKQATNSSKQCPGTLFKINDLLAQVKPMLNVRG